MSPSFDLQQATSRYLVRRRRLLFASNGALLLFLVAAGAAVATALFLLGDGGPRLVPAGITGTVSLASVALVAFVVSHFREIVETGRSADGVITRRTYLRNSWRIAFSYSLDGQYYEDHIGIVTFRPKVKVGDRVTVAVDPADPASALLPGLLNGRGPVPCLDAEPVVSTEHGTVTSFTIHSGAESRALGTLLSVLTDRDRIEFICLEADVGRLCVRRTTSGLESRRAVDDDRSERAESEWIGAEHDEIARLLKEDLVPTARRLSLPITGRYFSESEATTDSTKSEE